MKPQTLVGKVLIQYYSMPVVYSCRYCIMPSQFTKYFSMIANLIKLRHFGIFIGVKGSCKGERVIISGNSGSIHVEVAACVQGRWENKINPNRCKVKVHRRLLICLVKFVLIIQFIGGIFIKIGLS